MRRYTTPTLPMTVPVDLTGDTSRAYYTIKLMDSTGEILKAEERDLSEIRGTVSE